MWYQFEISERCGLKANTIPDVICALIPVHNCYDTIPAFRLANANASSILGANLTNYWHLTSASSGIVAIPPAPPPFPPPALLPLPNPEISSTAPSSPLPSSAPPNPPPPPPPPPGTFHYHLIAYFQSNDTFIQARS